VLIQVAESTQSRQEFTNRFVQRSAWRDGAIFALTLLTVFIVVTVALAPWRNWPHRCAGAGRMT
jgi:two-component system sensor histidine kinase TctE